MTDDHWMRMAIDKTRQGMRNGQMPFGAAIVKEGKLITVDHNLVFATTDITAHAEVTAIRNACRLLNTVDLTGCSIYSTTEPCPMCFAACHWARIDRIIFGSAIDDARAAGFSELPISNLDMKRQGGSKVLITPGFLREEAIKLFEEFAAMRDRKTY